MTASFPLTGEPLALDLVNTRVLDGTVDLLGTPEALADWLTAQAGRLAAVPGPVPEVGAPELAAVHAVRDTAARLIAPARAGQAPPPDALHRLNGHLAAAPAHRELGWGEDGFTAGVRRPAPLADRLAAELAEAVADLLTDPRLDRVRQCEGHDCVLLFLPAHPRRRWCVPSVCGNRARVARYYERHKGDLPESRQAL
ncbi:CGNR zinc finger domain-containing protein [Streptomyces sp. NPDC093225]|uniref:CGNR zinc finger domain-containing protein n=1 Tax=Streptomyces sp. NPDC093225 TaxID=3366034 RepID=UPI00382E7665